MVATRREAVHPTRSRRLIKILAALGLLVGLGFLFIHSASDSRAQPYLIPPGSVRPWRLAIEPGDGLNDPVLVLRPPGGLAAALSGQLFKRLMESMGPPAATGIPLVLRRELAGARAGNPPLTPEALLAAAREAGLDAAPLQPRCIGHRRSSSGDGRQQMYFVLFEVPTFARFRQRVGALLVEHGAPPSSFDPDVVSPALMLALIESSTEQWLPLRADPKSDCVAPIAVGAAQ